MSAPQYYTPTPGTMQGMPGSVPSYGVPQPQGSRWVRWTFLVIWLTVGFFISLIGGAILALLFFGDDPPTQATMIFTLAIYLIGAVAFVVWAKW